MGKRKGTTPPTNTGHNPFGSPTTTNTGYNQFGSPTTPTRTNRAPNATSWNATPSSRAAFAGNTPSSSRAALAGNTPSSSRVAFASNTPSPSVIYDINAPSSNLAFGAAFGGYASANANAGATGGSILKPAKHGNTFTIPGSSNNSTQMDLASSSVLRISKPLRPSEKQKLKQLMSNLEDQQALEQKVENESDNLLAEYKPAKKIVDAYDAKKAEVDGKLATIRRHAVGARNEIEKIVNEVEGRNPPADATECWDSDKIKLSPSSMTVASNVTMFEGDRWKDMDLLMADLKDPYTSSDVRKRIYELPLATIRETIKAPQDKDAVMYMLDTTKVLRIFSFMEKSRINKHPRVLEAIKKEIQQPNVTTLRSLLKYQRSSMENVSVYNTFLESSVKLFDQKENLNNTMKAIQAILYCDME